MFALAFKEAVIDSDDIPVAKLGLSSDLDLVRFIRPVHMQTAVCVLGDTVMSPSLPWRVRTRKTNPSQAAQKT